MKFGHHVDVDDPKVDIEGQGHRSYVKGQGHKVKKRYFRSHSTTLRVIFKVKVKGHMGQAQRSTLKVKAKGQGHQVKNVTSGLILQVMYKVKGHGSGSKITLVKFKGQVG